MKIQDLLIMDFEVGKDKLHELAVAVGRTDRLAASGCATIKDELRVLAEDARARLKENHAAAVEDFQRAVALDDVLEDAESALRDVDYDGLVDPVALFTALVGIDEWCCGSRALGLSDRLPERFLLILNIFVSDLCCVQKWSETFMHYAGVLDPDLSEYQVWSQAANSKETSDALDLIPMELAPEEIPDWLGQVMDSALAQARAEMTAIEQEEEENNAV